MAGLSRQDQAKASWFHLIHNNLGCTMIGSHLGTYRTIYPSQEDPITWVSELTEKPDVRTDVSSLPHIAEAVVNLCDAARR